ncbi:MAG: ParB/RepB/Spo0J family partition protein [Chloroflexi bacterium]|nr:ParB/RepB/Spo0J family partition protein [Chloroflexota bacterium]
MESKIRLQKVRINDITPDPNQPRKRISEGGIKRLADSYDGKGPEQPIIVRPYDGGYMLITGERRWRAAKSLGYTEIECIVKDIPDEKVLLLTQLRENLQREDLHPLEIGKAYLRANMSERKLAKELGVSRSRVHDYTNLAKNLSGLLTNQIGEGMLGLSTTQAIEIAKLKFTGKQFELAQVIVKHKITDYHHLYNFVKRVNLAMDMYGNIPMDDMLKEDAAGPSLEAIANEVLHVEKRRYAPREKKDFCDQLCSLITELSDALNPWLITNIPGSETARIKAQLENLSLQITLFQNGLVVPTSGGKSGVEAMS